jgi:hypothetical protein
MKDSSRERSGRVLYDLVSVAVFGFLVATVVAALSPENLVPADGGAAVIAAIGTRPGAAVSPPA